MKEIFNFKAEKKVNLKVNFPTSFCLGSLSDGFGNIEFREVY